MREFSKLQTVIFLALTLLFIASIGLGYGIFSFPIFAVAAFLYKSNMARCIVRTDSEKITFEITKSAWGPPATYTEFRWEELESFKYRLAKSETMTLKWLDNTKSHLFEGDLSVLNTYLCKYFPEKEQQ